MMVHHSIRNHASIGDVFGLAEGATYAEGSGVGTGAGTERGAEIVMARFQSGVGRRSARR